MSQVIWMGHLTRAGLLPTEDHISSRASEDPDRDMRGLETSEKDLPMPLASYCS